MQKMVIFIKANTYNTANLSKLGPRVVAHIILSHPNGCGVPCLGLGVISHKCLFAGPWGLIVRYRCALPHVTHQPPIPVPVPLCAKHMLRVAGIDGSKQAKAAS
jgi:hypothetical protein